jgi:hypothetical protein
VSANSITWSPTWIGGPLTAPIYIRNRSAKRVPIAGASLTGFSTGDFKISKNGCSGKTLAPRASCSLTLTFAPSPPGPRTAALKIRLGTVVDTVQLDVPLPTGTTSLTMQSQPGDFVGHGRKWDYTTANAGFFFGASPTSVSENVQVAGDGRGCDTDTGAFTVRQAVFSGSVLEHFDATFTQHCEGAAPALTGEIKYEYGNVSAPSQLFVTG